MTFEHKFCEAVELLMELGATELSVNHVSGWSKEFSAGLAAPIGTTGETVSAEVGAQGGNTSELLFNVNLEGTEKPKVPKNLVWYPHEPTWQTIAKGRTKHGLAEHRGRCCISALSVYPTTFVNMLSFDTHNDMLQESGVVESWLSWHSKGGSQVAV